MILDGEMLVWDPVSERNLPFGTLKTAALGGSPLRTSSIYLSERTDDRQVEKGTQPSSLL